MGSRHLGNGRCEVFPQDGAGTPAQAEQLRLMSRDACLASVSFGKMEPAIQEYRKDFIHVHRKNVLSGPRQIGNARR